LALAQTLLSRLDLTSVSEGDVFLSNQAHIRNLHESSWLHTIQLESIRLQMKQLKAQDVHCNSNLHLQFQLIIASVSEGDVLSTRVTIRNLSNSGLTLFNQLDAQDVIRNLISWHVLSGPSLVWKAESTNLRLHEQTSQLRFICRLVGYVNEQQLQLQIWPYFRNYVLTHQQQSKVHQNSLYLCLWARKYISYSSINRYWTHSCTG
jgi:hypothetical protein